MNRRYHGRRHRHQHSQEEEDNEPVSKLNSVLLEINTPVLSVVFSIKKAATENYTVTLHACRMEGVRPHVQYSSSIHSPWKKPVSDTMYLGVMVNGKWRDQSPFQDQFTTLFVWGTLAILLVTQFTIN